MVKGSTLWSISVAGGMILGSGRPAIWAAYDYANSYVIDEV